MIIGLCGPKLSGKGTAADYLVQQHHARTYSMSGVLRDILNRLALSESRANMIHLAIALRNEFGNDILARALLPQLARDTSNNVSIIDGIRYSEELTAFSALPNFRLLYITAPLLVRFERTKTRGEKVGEQGQSFEEFVKEEHAATEKHLVALADRAAGTIENNGTFDEFYKAIDAHVRTL